MVLSIHETSGGSWSMWRWWITRITGASALFAGLWWAITRDTPGTMIAAAIPWVFALMGLVFAIVWAVALIPLLSIVAKIGGGKSKEDET